MKKKTGKTYPPGSPEWIKRGMQLEAEEAKQPVRLMFLSFADDTGFLGAVVLEAQGPLTACNKAHELRINPGGEIVSSDLFEKDYPPVEAWNRLLNAAEVKQYFPTSKSYRDIEKDKAEAAQLSWERAMDHDNRGGLRGAYEGEQWNTPVAVMKDPTKGYTDSNTEVELLVVSLLIDAGFKREDIQEFFKKHLNLAPVLGASGETAA